MRIFLIERLGAPDPANRETDRAMLDVPILALVGSAVAVAAGFWAAAPPVSGTGPVGLIVAISGLITALATLIVPIANACIVAWSVERKAKWERHNLANRLQATMLELSEVQGTVSTQQARIHVLEGIVQDQRETLVLIATKRDIPDAPVVKRTHEEPPHAAR